MNPSNPTDQPPRWVGFVPSAFLVVAFSVKAVVQPSAVRDVFSSTQAFAVAFAIFAGWTVLWLLVLPRLVRNGWWRLGILSVIAGALVFTLVISSAIDDKVVEALPRVEAPRANDVDDTTEDTTSEATTSTTAPAAPVRIAVDALIGRGGHDASGTVAIYRQPDDTLVVGFEGIDVEPGPDYHVYVVPGRGREETGDDGVRLDSLRGNLGTQYYPVPSSIGLEPGEWTVLIWCRAFAVPIANATPA